VQFFEPLVVELNIDYRIKARVKGKGSKALAGKNERASNPAPFSAVIPAGRPKIPEDDRPADALIDQDDPLLFNIWQHSFRYLSKSKDTVKKCLTHFLLGTHPYFINKIGMCP
jgi:hypothetical protein